MTLRRESRGGEAAALDGFLDDLLAGRPGGPTPIVLDQDPGVDPQLAHAARAVVAALARFHPSFRFEERLAARLRADGQGTDVGVTPDRVAAGTVIPFAPLGGRPRSRSRRVNGALIGGAISAGVSIASIAAGAIVARRRSRSETRWERVI